VNLHLKVYEKNLYREKKYKISTESKVFAIKSAFYVNFQREWVATWKDINGIVPLL
jgi:hypothetical protein